MDTMHKYILISKRYNRIVLSSDSRESLVESATKFTLHGGGDTYSIFRNEMEITHTKTPVYKTYFGN